MPGKLHVFIGGVNNNDYNWIQKNAGNGRTTTWSSTKCAMPGDRVLLYIVRPHSALIARATVTRKSWPAKDWPFRCGIGDLRLMKSPVTIQELKKQFPRWRWLLMPRGKVTVPHEYEEKLWKLTQRKQAIAEQITGNGAGFGDPKTNPLVERAAVRKVTRYLQQKGYKVISREPKNLGYDLDAMKGRTTLHIEVKGVSGSRLQFPITRREVKCASKDLSFRLFVVTEIRTSSAKLHVFLREEFLANFKLSPISYVATRR
ncbi:MAG: protein NO VEIN domain-containing protein [Gemmataceae bacterium]